jgi:putative hydrolase of the HAD superfamily
MRFAPRSGIEAVAFDLDGTLYPNYRLYARLVPFILREWWLLWAFGRARMVIRAEQARSGSEIRPDFYDYQARIAANMLGADPVFIREKIERLIYRGWEEHFKRIRLFPHVAETLAALKEAGLKLGMLSDFPPETKLKYLGLGGMWDAALCTERIGALKPHRRPFEELAAALGCARERILYVGNSRPYDVEGARRAGMRAALVSGFFLKRNALQADFTFHDYRQLYNYMIH